MLEKILSTLPVNPSQVLGAFLYMVSEAVLGKTRFGSWLGLARAVVWFIVRTIVGGLLKALKLKSGQSAQKEGDNGPKSTTLG